MKKEWNDMWIGIFLFLFSLVAYFVIIPNQVYYMGQSGLSPTFFPKATVLLIAALSFMLVWGSIRKIVKNNRNIKWEFALFDRRDYKILSVICFIFFFIVIFKHFGFLIASILTLVPLIRFFGEKRYFMNFGISIFISIFVFYFFEKILKIVLH